MYQYPTTVIGTVLPLKAQFLDRATNALVTMTGGSAKVRVTTDAGAVVVSDATCTISGKTVTYLWDTSALAPGVYRVQFEGTPPNGTLFIEPCEALRVVLVSRIGG